MKKIHSAFYPFTLLFFIVLITACNNEPETPSVLQFVSSSGANYVSESRTLVGGTPVTTGVYAQVASSNQNLTKFKVTFNLDSTQKQPEVVYLDSTLSPETKTFAMPVSYIPRNQRNREIWQFTITDSEGKEYKKTINLKTTSGNTNTSVFYTYSDVFLSRIKNPRTNLDSLGFVGFASTSGTSYPAYAVKQPEVNKQIDLFFNHPGTTKPSLASLKGDSLRLTTLTSPQFEEISNANGLRSAYSVANPPFSTMENLQANQIIAFKTGANKVGLLRIDKVSKSLDSLTFDVKMQK